MQSAAQAIRGQRPRQRPAPKLRNRSALASMALSPFHIISRLSTFAFFQAFAWVGRHSLTFIAPQHSVRNSIHSMTKLRRLYEAK